MKLKEQLFVQCGQYVEERLQRISAALKDLENDLENETKSSAGDKYETGREMINAEWNKLSAQLSEFQKLKNILKIAEERQVTGNVQLGSIVKTTAANYFIAIPAGRFQINDENFFVVGINAPVAQVLLNKKKDDSMSFNGQEMKIITVE